MIKFKWHTIVEWYSFMATIAIVGLTLYGSKGTIASLRWQLVEVLIVFWLIVILSLAWAVCSWVAANAIEYFRSKKNKALKETTDPTTPRINLYLDKVEGGAIANGKIEGTYEDIVAMIALLIMRVAKGDRETLEDIIRMAKALFNYDTAKERKHD